MIPVPDLLHHEPKLDLDVRMLEELLGLAFTGRGEAAAIDRVLAGTSDPTSAASAFDPEHFAADLFVGELVRDALVVDIDGHRYASNPVFVERVLSSPPTDLRTTTFRQEILREMDADPAMRRKVERLYVQVWDLIQMFRVPGRMARLDIDLFHIELMRQFKTSVDAMVDDFGRATSGLRRLAEVGRAIQQTEEYRTLATLLDWEGARGTVQIDLRMGADGRVRSLAVRDILAHDRNPFFDAPWQRWKTKLKAIFWWGFRLDDAAIVGRLVQQVYDQHVTSIMGLAQLVGHLEIYIAMHQLRERAAADGLAMSLAEVRPEGDLALEGLFNPLLFAAGQDPVPCRVAQEDARSVALITGPNSGGKTRLLQSVGLAQLMGQGGFYVAASEARLVRVRGLFVSLIEHEAVDHSEGRLGRELERIRTMFDTMRVPTMVILDELCSGTNPSEGAEVFSLVLRLLERVRPVGLITTHFLDFARKLAEDPPIHDLRFLQVEIDDSQRSTYQFVPGVAETSLAQVMADRMGVTFDRIAERLDRHPDLDAESEQERGANLAVAC